MARSEHRGSAMSDASNDIGPGEAEMLAELQSVIDQVDGPPDDVVAAAKASFTWRTVDAELAELTFDSLVDEEAGTLVRSAEQPRLLTFSAGDVEIEVEATLAGHRYRLLGQIVPSGPGQLAVRQPAGPRAV